MLAVYVRNVTNIWSNSLLWESFQDQIWIFVHPLQKKNNCLHEFTTHITVNWYNALDWRILNWNSNAMVKNIYSYGAFKIIYKINSNFLEIAPVKPIFSLFQQCVKQTCFSMGLISYMTPHKNKFLLRSEILGMGSWYTYCVFVYKMHCTL